MNSVGGVTFSCGFLLSIYDLSNYIMNMYSEVWRGLYHQRRFYIGCADIFRNKAKLHTSWPELISPAAGEKQCFLF